MDTTQAGVSIREALGNIATGDHENFRIFFRRMRKMFPEEVAVACLGYIASRGLDEAGQTMAFWLTLHRRTIDIVFDAKSLPLDIASNALRALRKSDPDLPLKFLKAGEQITSPQQILRVLGLVPSLGDYSILLSWLRKLCNDGDERVRSRAVKLLCGLRPNKSQIERQMLSDDPRVRASAIEALWHLRTLEATELLKSAAGDAHHRVVGNAFVGLYLQGDQDVVARMIELCQSPDEFYRAAMAWCFGFVRDQRAVPHLQLLTKDSSSMVRKRALRSLLTLQLDEAAAPEKEVVEVMLEQEPVIQPDVAPVVNQPEYVPRFATLS
jgi:hypothetical protein